MTTQMLLNLAIGLVIPILNGLLTKHQAQKTRVLLQLVLNAANGFLIEWANALTTGVEYNVGEALTGTAISLVTAIAMQVGVWAPVGVSDWAKRSMVGSTTR